MMERMNETTTRRPIFSICHTTARPNGWQESACAWKEKATHSESVEYALCIDERWGFGSNTRAEVELSRFEFGKYKIIWNTGRKCMVDGFNTAAKAATGQILILNSDDMFPPEGWDEFLIEAIERWDPITIGYKIGSVQDFVIQVSSGTPADERGLMVLQILSRARYERLGYALYPEYESLFVDDDFSEHARHDDVVINAQHIVVEHRHPDWDATVPRDAVYAHENAPEAWKKGAAIFESRKSGGFPDKAYYFDIPDEDDIEDPTPLFSIVHATARPDKWRGIYDSWMANHSAAVSRGEKWSDVEYILVVDERWGFSTEANHLAGPDKIIWNDHGDAAWMPGISGRRQRVGPSLFLRRMTWSLPKIGTRIFLKFWRTAHRKILSSMSTRAPKPS